MIRTKGEPGTGDIVQAVRHMRMMNSQIAKLTALREDELFNAAKELLRFSIKPIHEVIEESGIRNSDLFRRLFLDSEGMSAEEYRMKWAQWVK